MGWDGCWGEGGVRVGGGGELALRGEPLLGERGLVGHRLVVVGAQLGHHVHEGQAPHLLVERLWRGGGGGQRGGGGPQ